MGLTPAEAEAAANAAEGSVAAAWETVLTSARARRDALLMQEARLEAACARLAHALGGAAPDFSGEKRGGGC